MNNHKFMHQLQYQHKVTDKSFKKEDNCYFFLAICLIIFYTALCIFSGK